jgi:ribosomal protein S18 acetylase RimI-like enzyme
MADEIRIVDVTAENVEREGFFCCKSKAKSPGYQQKLAWTKARFEEGLRLKILYQGKRSFAFIEYIPGAATWRAIDAPDYMVIHCLWVVGSGKKQGFASRLLDLCLEDAQASGLAGVAALASRGVWLTDTRFFQRQGFALVAQVPPAYDLVVRKFRDAPDPVFPTDWDARLAALGPGLVVVRSGQCPYLDDATAAALEAAAELNVPARVVEFTSGAEARQAAPCPFGVAALVYNGKLLTHAPQLKKDVIALLQANGAAPG